MHNREELIYMAKICEQTERFEDMLDTMKKVCEMDTELSTEERNLLSVAYKNTVGSRRTAWRALTSIESKEEGKGGKHLELIKEYKAKIEKELNDYCSDIITLLKTKLISKAASDEEKVFYLKMCGDYYRYKAEYASGDDHKTATEEASSSYGEATEIAKNKLKTTHPIRLGLALNYSVFFYEIKNDAIYACKLAKEAFDNAIGDIEELEEDVYRDSTTIMQLIRDNLSLWTSEIDHEDDGSDNDNN